MDKKEHYKTLLKQAEALIDQQAGDIANTANLSALLMQEMPQHWIGFYFVRNTELVLGPFQGPVACTIIQKGKGVCGKSWESGSTMLVDNVHEFEGHIACSPYSNSEIVIPCFRDGTVWAVLDIDSSDFSAFDEVDAEYLEKLVSLL